ncbi:hypothetical protein HYPSUDRAFT_59595 [Hypholoma sublateritium FD-334 SS-4]|uniref:Uncharacterized protein n=1 Tax=Hypholoma sublateritium (strain FD-334 SS-4) TaxID=945553 RepID=A0A0D2KHC3_HYPSF|nr:hypothetical protein HYPSUDRAFT_59595 [Hypholoma sublateritium FD-334 SS-4]
MLISFNTAERYNETVNRTIHATLSHHHHNMQITISIITQAIHQKLYPALLKGAMKALDKNHKSLSPYSENLVISAPPVGPRASVLARVYARTRGHFVGPFEFNLHDGTANDCRGRSRVLRNTTFSKVEKQVTVLGTWAPPKN